MPEDAPPPPWRIVGVSVRGPSHEAEGTECQDAHAFRVCDDGCLIAIACDGAGSTRFGGDAARFVCERLVAGLPDRPSELVNGAGDAARRRAAARALVPLLARIRAELLVLAADAGESADEYLCTVVAAVAHPELGGVFAHIGDGAALCLDHAGADIGLSRPRNGEFAGTTYFLAEDDWRRELRLSFFGAPFGAIVLMTDGAYELAFARAAGGARPHDGFFRPVSVFLARVSDAEGESGLRATLDGPAARAKERDDKTIVWARAAPADA